jgi:hypothetical protein
MEEGKDNRLGHSLVRLKEFNVYKNACATLEHFCLRGAGWDQCSFGEPVVLLVQLNVQGNGRRKNSSILHGGEKCA